MESESSYIADELGQYRSLSTAAIMALVLGLLSPMALFSPILLVVPLSGVAMASWALARIKRSEGGLLGARLAYCGLALAIVFGFAPVAREQVRFELLRRQASETTELWLSMLARGHADEALGLMTPTAISHLSTSETGDATVPIFTAALTNAQLLQDPLAKALIEMHKRGESPFVQRKAMLRYELKQPFIVLTYEAADAQAEVFSFTLSIKKRKRIDNALIWLVDAWQIDKADP